MRPRASTPAILAVPVGLLAAVRVAGVRATRPPTQQAVVGGQAFGEDEPGADADGPRHEGEAALDGAGRGAGGRAAEVQQAVWAANEIIGKPYRTAAATAASSTTGYDCSGTVSYALIGAEPARRSRSTRPRS